MRIGGKKYYISKIGRRGVYTLFVKVYLCVLEKRKEKGVRKILKSNYEYIRNWWNIFGHSQTKRRMKWKIVHITMLEYQQRNKI